MKRTPNNFNCLFFYFGLFCLILGPIGSFLHGQDPSASQAQLAAQTVEASEKISFLTLKNQFRIIGFLSIISLIPFAVMMMTSFLRVSIVFQFLRQALGSSQVPSNQIIIGLSLILTAFIMQPVINKAYNQAILPYMQGELQKLPEVQSGTLSEESVLIERIWDPLQTFLLAHARDEDLNLFLEISKTHFETDTQTSPGNDQELKNKIPWYCLIPAFMLSELRTAFMMGFLLFLPFLIIDMVVSAILMSMGMMMLPPVMVSTPCKILLFIMIDGWHLIVQQVISGFH